MENVRLASLATISITFNYVQDARTLQQNARLIQAIAMLAKSAPLRVNALLVPMAGS